MPESEADLQELAAVGLGSNLPSHFGAPEDNVNEALRRLAELGAVVKVSSFRETEPVGYIDQPRFVNAVALLRIQLEPLDLLRGLMAIEHAMGRDRAGVPAKGPRVIDLDLLLFGDRVLELSDLTLPHPAIAQRRFVLEPLAEVAPEMRHPLLGKTARQLLEAV